eukprot:7324751-Alexandrium_andersonii.AAC.1
MFCCPLGKVAHLTGGSGRQQAARGRSVRPRTRARRPPRRLASSPRVAASRLTVLVFESCLNFSPAC